MNNKLYQIITEVFEITLNDTNDNLGPEDIEKWDSLGQLHLISALEDNYNICFEIEEIFEIFTISDIKIILQRKGVI